MCSCHHSLGLGMGCCWLPKRIYRLQIVFSSVSPILVCFFTSISLFPVVAVALFVCCQHGTGFGIGFLCRIRPEIADGIGMQQHVPEVFQLRLLLRNSCPGNDELWNIPTAKGLLDFATLPADTAAMCGENSSLQLHLEKLMKIWGHNIMVLLYVVNVQFLKTIQSTLRTLAKDIVYYCII